MIRRKSFLHLLLLLIVNISLTQAQSIQGIIFEKDTNLPVIDVEVYVNGELKTTSNVNGEFAFETEGENNSILLKKLGYQESIISIPVQNSDNIILEPIYMTTFSNVARDDLFDVVTLDDTEVNDDDSGQDISSVLNASQDVFSRVGYSLFSGRFRVRGYEGTAGLQYINGILVNDLESGRVGFSSWGGLNDVFRNRESVLTGEEVQYSFGGISGASNYDLRASSQRVQTRVSYAVANRSYRHRLMGTHSTGLMDSGWAVTLSGSRRWAQEGYVEGTFYDGYAYFLSVDKVLNKRHVLNLVAFGSPQERGRSGGSIQEMYDIAGSNYYNSYWGFQNGEKRNARVYDSHEPVVMLRHDWTPSDKTTLTTVAFGQKSIFGSSNLDWYNASDPRPDYWRKLPSGQDGNLAAAAVWAKLSSDQASRQLQWDEFYDANRNNAETIQNVNGTPGNSVTGLRSNYILQEQHFDTDKIVLSTNLKTVVNSNFQISAGLNYNQEANHNFKKVKDLLGGEFYVDYNQFAERDFPGNIDILQSDLNNPNRLVGVGDRYGYDYDIHINQTEAWISNVYQLSRFDLKFGGKLSKSSFYREGFMKTGTFPDSSFGKSETTSFTNWGARGGVSFKIDGRNYINVNGIYETKAPNARNSFVSPRIRDQIVSNLQSEKIKSAEITYHLRYPSIKAKASAYYTKIDDQISNTGFYHDDLNSFVNFILTDVDQVHKGVELAFEADLGLGFTLSGLASLGEYVFDSRPIATISQDNNAELLGENVTIYQKGYLVPGTPQTAFVAKIGYNSPNFWFANISASFFNDIYLDFNPTRRTVDGIAPLDPESDANLVNTILAQERLPSDYMIDFFGGKSWRINGHTLFLNAGINNILNNTSFITGGFEQSRFDFESKDVNRFPPRYFYSFGTNYFIGLTLTL